MRTEERALAAERLRQVAREVGVDLDQARFERMMSLYESTLDGTRAAAELGTTQLEPAIVPDLDAGSEP